MKKDIREHLNTMNKHTIGQSSFNSLHEVQPQNQNMNPRIFANYYETQMENGIEAKPIEDYKYKYEEGTPAEREICPPPHQKPQMT
jgi:hypothetical protein